MCYKEVLRNRHLYQILLQQKKLSGYSKTYLESCFMLIRLQLMENFNSLVVMHI